MLQKTTKRSISSFVTAKTGIFCPTSTQYVPEVKVLQFRDLTREYKGKKDAAGGTVKTLSVIRVQFDLASPSASNWFIKKITSTPPAPKGTAVGEYVIFYLESKPNYFAAGSILSIDGVKASTFSADELLKRFK